jgi:cellulose synthase/poly-beta-1,6-N-acetylglucosamine synthase-like glycosyltransferase
MAFVYFPGILILTVFLNRYFFGLFLRQKDTLKSRFRLVVKPDEESEFSYPKVAVIVPLYNEGSSIYDTLISLASSDYPEDRFEIRVVDDFSSDDSVVWARKAAALHSNIHITKNPFNMGKRLGIARAVRNADCEFIVSVDSDVIVEPHSISRLIESFTKPEIAAVGGRVSVSNANKNWLTQMQTVKYWLGYEFLKNLENSFESVMCLSGCLTAYRRHVLLELEPILENRNLFGVSIKYGEDRFLTRQIVKAGYKTKLNLEAECYTKAPDTLTGYFSQQLRWRRSNMVDFFGALSHIWKQDPFVTLHYMSLYTLILSYPAILWMCFLQDEFMQGFAFHLGVLAVFSLIYSFGTRFKAKQYRVLPVSFLAMGALLPVTYMVLNILALFTLDSGSWETRKSKPLSN